ncbi:MAG: two-component regulator propeller domain-containing protein [Bacteroidota bacterium]
MNFEKRTICLVLFMIYSITYGQNIAIGQWRDHLPYNNAQSVTKAGKIVYCATPNSIIVFNTSDESMSRLTKVNGLADIGITKVRYSEETGIVVVGYSNGNLDMIEGDRISNLPDIKRKQMPGSKSINNILFKGNYAYLSTSFGIVVVDLVRKEIKDTWYIGPFGTYLEVLDLAVDSSKFYAATANGFYEASVNSPNLADYNSWNKNTSIPHPNGIYNTVCTYNGKVFTSLKGPSFNTDTIFYYTGSEWKYFNYPNAYYVHEIKESNKLLVVTLYYNVQVFAPSLELFDVVWTYGPGTSVECKDGIVDEDYYIWVADVNKGLVRYKGYGALFLKPGGPDFSNVMCMSINKDDLWIVPGGHTDTWGSVNNQQGIAYYVDNIWETISRKNTPQMDTLMDLISVVVDPTDRSRVYAASWGHGLLYFDDWQLTTVYNEQNSPLQKFNSSSWYFVGLGGLCFDEDKTLWMTNPFSTSPLLAMKSDGTWQTFTLNNLVASTLIVSQVLVDNSKQKWILMPRDNNIVVFNDNNTLSNPSDDKVKKLSAQEGNGNLPGNSVNCMALDLDGEVWIGTDAGIGVFYTPEQVFSGQDFDAQQILIEQDGYAQYLLEFENISCIAIDGGNRKWIGTINAGAFLMSDDGTEEILHFTADNSPLPSNTINSIVINPESGEVYFGTGKGIVSYKGTATEGKDDFSSVYAYPNPVRPEYTGLIGIKNLVTNAHVKITDISGNLVYECFAEGGQAVWNGKNYNGEKVQSGVYLVFCTTADGKDHKVSKILFMN